MTKWALLLTIAVVVAAFFLASGIITEFPGHEKFQTDKAGILSGIIHGAIAPIMLVIALFTKYTAYEINNTGWFYNLGYIVAMLMVWGGGSHPTEKIIQKYYDKNKHQQDVEKAVEKAINKKQKQEEIKKETKEKTKTLKEKLQK